MPLPVLAGAAATALGASEGTALAAEAATAAGLGALTKSLTSVRSAVAGCQEQLTDFARGVGLVGLGLTAAATAAQAAGNQLAAFVSRFSPAAVARFQLASDNLTASIGRLLLPVLDKLTPVLRTIGDAFGSLQANGKTVAVAAAAAGAAIGVATAAVVGLGAAVTVAFGGIPLLVGAVAGGMVGLGVALKDVAAVQKAAAGVLNEAVRVVNAFGAAVQVLVPALEPAADAAGRLGKAVADQLIRAVLVAAPALERVGGVVVDVLDALADAMGPLQPVIDRIVGVATRFGAALAEYFGAKVSAVAGLLADLAPGLESLTESIGELLGSGFELVSEVFDAVADSVFGLTDGADGLNDALDLMAGAVRFVAREVLPTLTANLVQTVQMVATTFEVLSASLTAALSPAKVLAGVVSGLFGFVTRAASPGEEPVPDASGAGGLREGAGATAARPGSSSDLLAEIKRTQEIAFGNSAGKPEERTANYAAGMAQTLTDLLKETQNELPKKIATNLATALKQTGGSAYQSASDSTAGQFARATVPGLNVADWLARQAAQQVFGD